MSSKIMSKPNHKNMPSRMRIIKYWLNKHEKHPEAKRWMDRVGEYFVERTCQDGIDICFACDFINGEVHRAHIKALSQGGDNHCSNLHILCRQCHKDSEFIEGDAYWDWIADRNIQHVYINACVLTGYFTNKEAAILLAYLDGDKDVRIALTAKYLEVCGKVKARQVREAAPVGA